MDPFRLRAGVWLTLTARQRRSLFKRLHEQLELEIANLERRDYEDPPDRIQSELAIQLLKNRIVWLRREGAMDGPG